MADGGSHARHDRFAIADAIGGRIAPAAIRMCPACGALHADLLSLQRAVREAWTPPRPRDLRLSVADALRLRRRTLRQRLDLIGSSRDALTRPLALSFTALGLIGLLLTAIPMGFPIGAAGATPAEHDRTTVAAAPGASASPGVSAAAASPGVSAPVSAPAASSGVFAPAAPGDPGTTNAITDDAGGAVSPSPLTGLSLVLLTLGGTIFAVRRLASHMGPVR